VAKSGGDDDVQKEFDQIVNMTPTELDKWLKSDDSKSVGFKHEGESESVGHESGHRIIAIKNKKKGDLDEDDYNHMHKVVAYVRRHTAQGGPKDDKEHSRWRYSLMNWGHDPLKK
jgi:hypothetical protein